jgi:hypothetical protein
MQLDPARGPSTHGGADNAGGRCPGFAYERRRPEDGVLHAVVRSELASFLAAARERERPVPAFVARELSAYLRCGVLAHGFVRVHCDACGLDRIVAFSCKGRGFCPSCGGRRMADSAAHLVDRVLPHVPVRQWVLSLPWALRYRLAYDARLTSAILQCFLRGVFGLMRVKAKRRGLSSPVQCGAVTFIQRFGDGLHLNVHFHSLVLDGVYTLRGGGAARFHALPPPTDEEIAALVQTLARRIARLLERRGLAKDADPQDADPLARDEPLLASLYGASVASRIATGPRAGRRVERQGDRIDADALPRLSGPRCASASGVSLHANVAIPARDRKRLERLCRYVARPALASQRLSRLPDGKLLYELKHPWRDGTTGFVFTPGELIEKLAALVPAPRSHLVRYHGILRPAARARRAVIPRPEGAPDSSDAIPRTDAPRPHPEPPTRVECPQLASPGPQTKRDRTPWADLLQRVFAIDVRACPRCHGRLRILAILHSPTAIRKILDSLDLPARAPPTEPARHDPAFPPESYTESFASDP